MLDDIAVLKTNSSNLPKKVKVYSFQRVTFHLVSFLQCFIKCIGELKGLVSENLPIQLVHRKIRL
jgi:hypothetical protein